MLVMMIPVETCLLVSVIAAVSVDCLLMCVTLIGTTLFVAKKNK